MTEQNNETDNTTNTKPAKNGKKQLIIIIVMAALSTFIPYIMFYTGIGIPEGTKNNGILLDNPVSVTELTLTDVEGKTWLLKDQKPKFRITFLVESECDDDCKEMLYITRQVDKRLGKESDQFDRIYINLGAPLTEEFSEYLKTEHPRLTVLTGNREDWQAILLNDNQMADELDGHEYYLLHRYGALVMAFNENHNGNELLSDLKFLIKTSN
ncbi:MAG: SCO family protein [Cellvibrionaceae bacterium]